MHELNKYNTFKEAADLEFFNERDESDEELKNEESKQSKAKDKVDMIDQLLAQLKTDDDYLLTDEDDLDDLMGHNPLEDEEAAKESEFLKECMNVLNSVKKTGDVAVKEDVTKKRQEIQKLLEEQERRRKQFQQQK